MKKLLSYPLSVLHYLIFGFLILIFQPIQWFCHRVFGYTPHKNSVDILNYLLQWSLYVLGTKIEFESEAPLPKDVPLIIVSNHQSSYEIIAITWYFRKYHPKFVSKIELGSGIPSVSYNLKHGGSVLIDRKDSKQALTALAGFGKNIQKNNWAAVIFPEGTRSRNGQPKSFSVNGLKMLAKYAPDAHIVPLTINNSWKLVAKGVFPLGVGVPMKFKVHKAIPVNSLSFNELFEKAEKTIKNSVYLPHN